MVVIYNPFYKSFKFYRDGVKIKVYNPSWVNDKCERSEYEGQCRYDFKHVKDGAWCNPIEGGLLIDETSYNNQFIKFFCDDFTKCKPVEYSVGHDGKKVVYEYIVYEGDLNVCFTDGVIVFYRNVNYTPTRETFKFKTLSKTAKKIFSKWCVPDYKLNKYSYIYHDGYYQFNGWKFKKEDDYVVFPLYTDLIYKLTPEIYNYNKEFISAHITNYSERNEWLYNLEPFNTGRDYDVSKEEREEIELKRIVDRKAKIKREKELEKLKNTPGYCSVCGAPDASYVANPYDEEMYGSIVMEWLCSKCYDDACGDI